jgi:hypothetical protein
MPLKFLKMVNGKKGVPDSRLHKKKPHAEEVIGAASSHGSLLLLVIKNTAT